MENLSTKCHFHRLYVCVEKLKYPVNGITQKSISVRATIQNSICLKWQIVYAIVQELSTAQVFF